MNIEAEFQQLARRLANLEEMLRALASEFQAFHPALVANQATMLQRFVRTDQRADQLVKRLDSLNTQVWSLRDDLPSLIVEAMRHSDDSSKGSGN